MPASRAAEKIETIFTGKENSSDFNVDRFIADNDRATDFSDKTLSVNEEEVPAPAEPAEPVFTSGVDYSADDFSAIAENIRTAINDVISDKNADIDKDAFVADETEIELPVVPVKELADEDFDDFADDFSDFSDASEVKEEVKAEEEVKDETAAPATEESPLVDSFDFDFAAFEDFALEEKKDQKPSIFKKKGKKGKK